VVVTSRRRDPRGDPGGESGIASDDARAARAAGLDSLARRDHSAAELRRKLIEKGYATSVAAHAVDRLCDEKLVDDRRYVENFVSLRAARGQGPLRIRADLKKSGIEGELVEHALEAYPDWLLQLRKAHQKKFGTRQLSDYADRVRRARFLSYRGFTGGQIRMALGFDTDLDVDT
jgi:regulatory protein